MQVEWREDTGCGCWCPRSPWCSSFSSPAPCPGIIVGVGTTIITIACRLCCCCRPRQLRPKKRLPCFATTTLSCWPSYTTPRPWIQVLSRRRSSCNRSSPSMSTCNISSSRGPWLLHQLQQKQELHQLLPRADPSQSPPCHAEDPRLASPTGNHSAGTDTWY